MTVSLSPVAADPTASQIALHTRKGWQAQLRLHYCDRGDKTVLKHREQKGPLTVQQALYPEGDICHSYLLHPPGGVAGGDTLDIRVDIAAGAKALVTTPGATKFYRSEGRFARQLQHLSVEEGGRLEWLPQENIFFPGAHAQLNTAVHLAKGAQFVGWELHCFGRPALKECFSSGKLIGKTEVYIEGRRVIREGLNFTGGDKVLINIGMQGFPMMGTLYLSEMGQDFYQLVQGLLSDIQSELGGDKLIVAATQVEGLIVVRALGHWSEDILHCFIRVWQQARRQMTGIVPSPPRIWAT
ncbi:urease accessory protein ureD [Photobacterium gaetbulicola]|uniref:Urease accessory protein UreD n=1 Tax=Photobacterium gaetbulicola TaxID=1295392 RepID=A0A0B9H229_9GAMM|nr:urease accessory protein UreD [Photobacterium gaetbulicola]KHT65001.1 urease accessory protein ureD [Photobacterium gaetbulicola]